MILRRSHAVPGGDVYQKVCRMCRVAVFVLRAVAFLKFVIVASLPADVLWGSFVTHSFLPHGSVKHLVEENTQNGRAKYLQSM